MTDSVSVDMDAFRINVFVSLTSWPSSVLSSGYLASDKYGTQVRLICCNSSSKDIFVRTVWFFFTSF